MNRPLIVAAAVGLALLAGCGQTVEPSPPPTSEDALTTTSDAADETEAAPTTEAPETEEPEADGPPEMPDEATEQTEAGAEAFATFYLESLDYAYATARVDHLPPLAGPDCESCTALAQDIPPNPKGEQTFEGNGVSAELIGDDLARVETGLVVLRGPGAGEGSIVFDLYWEDGSWIVDSIRLQQER